MSKAFQNSFLMSFNKISFSWLQKWPAKLQIILLTTAVLFGLTGCPYESRIPISSPSTPIDNAILGKWSQSKYSKNYLIIAKQNARQYKITEYKYNSSKKQYTTKIFQAHLSIVSGKKYLNIKTQQNKYYLYRYAGKVGGKFYLEPVTSNIKEKFSNSSRLANFIKKHQHLSFFVEKKQTFYKR